MPSIVYPVGTIAGPNGVAIRDPNIPVKAVTEEPLSSCPQEGTYRALPIIILPCLNGDSDVTEVGA